MHYRRGGNCVPCASFFNPWLTRAPNTFPGWPCANPFSMYFSSVRYINDSVYGSDNFFQGDNWFYQIKIGDYQLATVFFNLFLILIPLAIYALLLWYWRRTRFIKPVQKIFAGLIFFFWLIFIPNTAYVITEVRHLLNYCPPAAAFKVCEQGAWIILFFFSYALIGLIAYYYLVTAMRRLIKNIFGDTIAKIFIVCIIPAIALGVLLGLLNRWNTWELFIYPLDLFNTLITYISYPLNLKNWFIFSAFLSLFYFAGNYLFKERVG